MLWKRLTCWVSQIVVDVKFSALTYVSTSETTYSTFGTVVPQAFIVPLRQLKLGQTKLNFTHCRRRQQCPSLALFDAVRCFARAELPKTYERQRGSKIIFPRLFGPCIWESHERWILSYPLLH